jgi:hypothetical protein
VISEETTNTKFIIHNTNKLLFFFHFARYRYYGIAKIKLYFVDILYLSAVFTKHTYKTKDRVTRTPLKTRDELKCSRKVGSSCSTSGTRPGNLITNPVISHE